MMPSTTDVEIAQRALVAFTILTDVRDGALTSLKLKHVDLESHVSSSAECRDEARNEDVACPAGFRASETS
jgi:hypothetical protein